MSKIYVPATLRRFTDGRSTVEINGSTVAEIFRQMDKLFPNLQGQLHNENGQIKSHLAVFVNDVHINELDKENTVLVERDEVYIIPAIAGG
jgi:molybdopterin converting factor small subunit